MDILEMIHVKLAKAYTKWMTIIMTFRSHNTAGAQ
jgi:hypothetical protein